MISALCFFCLRIALLTSAVRLQTEILIHPRPSWIVCAQIASLMSFGSVFTSENEEIVRVEMRQCFAAIAAFFVMFAVSQVRL